ncbi:MAG: hypothetical protein LBN99_02015 [Oscillospiraceae bacterium]|jgi:hypothetical protein|nr:hypothetical protein [Oscillospiraceae bacterium]
MTETLRSFIAGVVGAAMITAVALTVTPEGRVKRIVAAACGFLTLLAILRPVKAFDYGSLGESLARLRADAGKFSAPLDAANENLARGIIEEKYAAYILDKGIARGMADLEAAVTVRLGDDGRWYPASARLTSSADAQKKDALTHDIETELGIPSGEIAWTE